MKPASDHLHRQTGFTLMELVIGMVLLGFLSVVGTTMISGSFTSTRVITNQHLAYASARYAMERVTREVREIQYDTTTKALGISSMGPTQLSFTKSGLGSPTPLTISYVSPQVLLTTGGSTAPLLSDVSAFTLSYLDTNRQVTTVSNDVRYVRIALTMAPQQAQALSLITQVSLRNL